MRKTIVPICFLIFFQQAMAQRTGPEQDCSGALFICGNNFTQYGGYLGPGQNNNELPDTTCLYYGETNSVWYTFTIDSPGTLAFLIEPLDTGNGTTDAGSDYDFALFDVTGHTCTDIATGVAPEVRCDFALSSGIPTGIDTTAGDTGTTAGIEGAPILSALQVQQGQQFKLLINNLQSNVSGFTLDFSHSTCSFINSSPQTFFTNPIDTVLDNPFLVYMNYFVYCDSISPTGGNFTFIGPAGISITKVQPNGNCTGTTNSLVFTLSSKPAVGTTFQIALKPNSLSSPCGNLITTPDTENVYQDTSHLIGIEQVNVVRNILLSPNPTSGLIHVKLPLAKAITYLQVYNTLGMLISQQEISFDNTNAEIDLNGQAEGVYMLLVKQGDAVYSQRVVKY